MKSLLRVGILSLAVLFATSSFTFAQKRGGGKARPSPNAEVSQTIGTTVVSITYGRPGLKGRTLEKMTPKDKVWRTGANESTVITLSGDVKIGGTSIDAGTYSIYTIPQGDKWTIIINSKLSWGTQYDEAMDVERISVPATRDNGQVEWFTIYFSDLSDTSSVMNLRWGDTIVAATITVK
ncbi:MAG: DUF2911 domain-containing protein [Verrucomicrobia bacterium]|nr:DUF2911 domain-containing protein [Verrucomicrobiota bacterium]